MKINLRTASLLFLFTVAPLVLVDVTFGFLSSYAGLYWLLVLIPWAAFCAWLTRGW